VNIYSVHFKLTQETCWIRDLDAWTFRMDKFQLIHVDKLNLLLFSYCYLVQHLTLLSLNCESWQGMFVRPAKWPLRKLNGWIKSWIQHVYSCVLSLAGTRSHSDASVFMALDSQAASHSFPFTLLLT